MKKTDPLSGSLAKLSGSSRGIPADKDFHFYNNFDEFKLPVREIAEQSQSMLDAIGQSSAHLWGKELILPEEDDDAYDWLVNVNDEIFERFDIAVDEFQKLRKGEDENGFQLVHGKKKKEAENSSLAEVKVARRDSKSLGTKPKVPFHIATIRRPQDEYKILVNNSNQPFEHVLLQKSEDGSRFIHPLEKFSAVDFVDKNIGDIVPVKPPPVECTMYKLVEEVKDLKELAAKLRGVDEFAVDLEHNQYRSFQGLTCLMQISTRAEDFIVDTLKLRRHIGPYLREVFKDHTKKKVMHGADRDIIWLQRDFGIYVCNMFDTGQASRVLKLERNSLEYLLQHFCEVTANKEYQNADWRLRPLTDVMLRYAREDTHYLLHIYDLMRIRLSSLSAESENSETSLLEVYQRSYDICMQLYEKEILNDGSYLHIYGIRDADLNSQQLAVVAGLCEWRDVVARAEDESTGYILPNKILIEIAKQMPLTTSKLRRLVSKNQYIDHNLGAVVTIIRRSVQNASAYEATSKHLKEERQKVISDRNAAVADGSEALSTSDILAKLETDVSKDSLLKQLPDSVQLKENSLEKINMTEVGKNQHEGSVKQPVLDCRNSQNEKDGYVSSLPSDHLRVTEQLKEASGAEATVQVLKKPNRAFGALLGSSAAKRKFDPGRKEKEEVKLEQIKSSVNLPFHSFTSKFEPLQPVAKESTKPLILRHEEPADLSSERLTPVVEKSTEPSEHHEPAGVSANSHLQEIILLDDDSDGDAVNDDLKSSDVDLKQREDNTTVATQSTNSPLHDLILLDDDSDDELINDYEMSTDNKLEQNANKTPGSCLETEDEDETMSLADLSSSFSKCVQSTKQIGKAKIDGKFQEPTGLVQVKPFDYEAALKQVDFGQARGRKMAGEGDDSQKSRRDGGKRRKNLGGKSDGGEESGGFQLGRRRQAFPPSGNRSASYR